MNRLMWGISRGLTGLSLLLCVSTVVLWVRSYLVADGVFHEIRVAKGIIFGETFFGTCTECYMGSWDGAMFGRWGTLENPPPPVGSFGGMDGGSGGGGGGGGGMGGGGGYPDTHDQTPSSKKQREVILTMDEISSNCGYDGFIVGNFAAILVKNPPDSETRYYFAIMIPYWLAAAMLGVLPSMWGWRLGKLRRRRLRGQCLVCGYDLRATPHRCPECGTLVGAKVGAALSVQTEVRDVHDV